MFNHSQDDLIRLLFHGNPSEGTMNLNNRVSRNKNSLRVCLCLGELRNMVLSFCSQIHPDDNREMTPHDGASILD